MLLPHRSGGPDAARPRASGHAITARVYGILSTDSTIFVLRTDVSIFFRILLYRSPMLGVPVLKAWLLHCKRFLFLF
jgi:hypothetical protein